MFIQLIEPDTQSVGQFIPAEDPEFLLEALQLLRDGEVVRSSQGAGLECCFSTALQPFETRCCLQDISKSVRWDGDEIVYALS